MDSGVTAALEDVSFAVPKGSAVAVVDPDGLGKQAVIRLAGRAALANGGTVAIRGRTVYLGTLTSLVMGNLTARENLLLLCQLYGLAEEDLSHSIPEITALVGAGKMMDLPVRRIGQRVFNDLALAMVCCLRPEVVAAEEILPMVLSQRLREELVPRFKANLDAGQTLIFSSRRFEPIVELSTHLLLIEDGKIIAFGPTEEVMESHGTWTADAVEAAAKIIFDQALVEDEEDDEMDPLDQMLEDDLIELDTGHGPQLDATDSLESTKTEKFGKLGFKNLGDLAYETRQVDLCRFVESESEPIIFSQEMTPQPRKEYGSREAKTIDPRRPFKIKFHVETRRPGVSIRPMVDLFSKRVSVFRSISPAVVNLAKAGRHVVEVEIPPNLFADRMYLVNVAVLVRDESSGDEDMLIERNLDYFYVAPEHGPWAAWDMQSNGADLQLAPPLVQRGTEWLVDSTEPSELLAVRDARLEGGGSELDGLDDYGEPAVVVGEGEAVPATIVVETFRPDLSVAAKVELLIDETLAVELIASREAAVRKPGFFNLRTEIPAEVLMCRSYRVAVSVRAWSQAEDLRGSYRFVLPMPLRVVTESDGLGAEDRFHSVARPAVQANLPWNIEAIERPSSDGGGA